LKINLIKSSFYYEEESKKALTDFILNSGKLSMGEKCLEFEQKFSQYQGCHHSVLYNSGSSANLALIQALLNLGKLTKGDKVGVSAVTWATNVMPLIQLGLEPVPIDVNLETINIDSVTLRRTLETSDIKCLFISHILGFCSDLDNIVSLCAGRGIILIEDTCESFGSVYQGKKLGGFGLASTFSTFVGHHLSTIEGGLVCTDDSDLNDMLIITRAHGWDRSLSVSKQTALRSQHAIDSFYSVYSFYDLGYNLRPTEITGFLGGLQLEYADEIVARREANFLKFRSCTNLDVIPLEVSHLDIISNFAYPIVCKNKKAFVYYKDLFSRNIEIRPLVSGNIARQPFFHKYVSTSYSLPNADHIHDFGFYIPNNPELTLDEVNYIMQLLETK